jgi:hypothetical protein
MRLKKMLLLLVFMVSVLLGVGLVSSGIACEFEVFKFHDYNSNGEWDTGEPAIEGWQIQLYRQTWDGWELVATSATNADGRVFFVDLWGDQTWRLSEEQRECWEPTTDATREFFAPSGSLLTFYFGNVYTCDVGEGCTPGYWRNHFEMWAATGYSPGDDFDSTFGVDLFDPDITLGDAIWLGGGGANRLARHGTAALLSAAHPDVDYPYTVGEVILAVQGGDASTLAEANELECPLN